MQKYHDREWGVPVRKDQKHFEFLVLESAQAGLSWRTVLNKRENYRKAFAGFDPVKVAKFGRSKVRKLLQNAGISRLTKLGRCITLMSSIGKMGNERRET